MLLAVDIGNTKIAIGFLDGGTVLGTYRLTTQANHTSDEYTLMLRQFMALQHLTRNDIDGVVISSVVPKLLYSFRASIVKFLNIDPLIVGPGVKTGINIALDNPRMVGTDRIADSVAAYHLYGGPVLVIDFGTATTYDYVDEHGSFRAGAINVGFQTAANALTSSTAQLPDVELDDPGTVLGTSSASFNVPATGPSSTSSSLATTGTAIAPYAVVAVLLLCAAGVVLLLVVRSRKKSGIVR